MKKYVLYIKHPKDKQPRMEYYTTMSEAKAAKKWWLNWMPELKTRVEKIDPEMLVNYE